MIRCALVALLVLAFTPLVYAQTKAPATEETTPPWPRGNVQIGGFILATESTFRIGESNVGVGINLGVEDFLDLSATNTAFRIDAGWRFSRNLKHRVTLSWFRLDRSGTTTTTKDIELPDSSVIAAGTGISSIFNFAIIRLKYQYSFLLDERIDLNLGAGLYIMPVKYGTGEVGATRTEQSITAPLPVISVGFNVALSTAWNFRQSGDLMYLTVSGVTGSVIDLNMSIERTVYRRIALGLGFESLNISFDTEKDSSYPGADVEGYYGFKYTGLQLYVRGNF